MKKITVYVAMMLCLATGVVAQKAEIFSTDGKAIKGYDPVAFFKAGKAVKGNDSLTYQWKETAWYFATKENLESFKTEPNLYAPQYGGYCAYGTAEGHKAPTETGTWAIINNKLYFNYNQKVKSLWEKNQAVLINKADATWKEIKNKE